jgi:starch-binding outer membrane protein, SusD/RagB family
MILVNYQVNFKVITNMKKFLFYIISVSLLFISVSSCKKSFLDIKPAGIISDELLATDKGIEYLLVGTYSMLPGDKTWNWNWEAASSNWLWGTIRGMEANRGSDAGDQTDIGTIQCYRETPYMSYLNPRWRSIYEGVSRCNRVVAVTNYALSKGKISSDQADIFIRQARVLRGWYHFEAWRMWEKIPYVDENTDPATVTNSADVRDQILADLEQGTGLPLNMGAIGKFNKTVSQVLYGKALMQMYHDYVNALPVLLDAATNGKKANGAAIGLSTSYGEIFDIVNRNGIESIYTLQYSVNDGSGGKNGGDGEVLNFPYKIGGNAPGGCCGFLCPTQEFVNSFRTSGGLPLLDDSYDNPANAVKSDQGLLAGDPFTPDAGPLDPRLDWSVGRRGIPYWDWGKHTGADWLRDQSYSGPYSPKKQVYKKSQEGIYTETGNWTSGWTANGYRMIRYADLLLLIAECQVETNDLPGARTNINLVRARAANPAGFVMDGAVPAANYAIATYPPAGYPFDSQANARKALYMERKLELGQEGHRYFDLNRWGITLAELNRALTYEKSMPWGVSAYGSAFAGPEDITYPIPLVQIKLSQGKLLQNR